MLRRPDPETCLHLFWCAAGSPGRRSSSFLKKREVSRVGSGLVWFLSWAIDLVCLFRIVSSVLVRVVTSELIYQRPGALKVREIVYESQSLQSVVISQIERAQE